MKINIFAKVAAEPQKVWECYTLPQHIVNWNFASDDWHCPEAENNMEPGGMYRTKMAAKDGSFSFDFVAQYNEVSPGKYFRYTMPDQRVIEVWFEPMENETEIKISFDAENENSHELQQAGWQAILNNFKSYTETH